MFNLRGLQNETVEEELSLQVEILQYASIPIISALVGFFTNWIALKMTFYPTYFFGVKIFGKYSRCHDQPAGCIGWQGIIPTKAAKMAAQSVDLMTEKVFDITEIFERIEPEQAAIHLKAGFELAVGGIISELSDKYIISQKTDWKAAEAVIKKQVTNWALQELPVFSQGFMKDLVQNLDDVYDLKDMCVTEMSSNPQLLNDIFENVGRKELIFIRNSGAYFGFVFGVVQLIVWFFFPLDFILPLFGFLVGYATNAIALKMIFSPVNPRVLNICGKKIVIQGLFLKRQKEASISFARRIVGTVLHSENIWKHMLNGPKSGEFKKLLDKHVDAFTDQMVGYSKPLVIIYLGEEKFKEMKGLVRELSQQQIEKIIEFMHEYTDEALDLENEIATKMAALPSQDFEQVLHPVFEEDEIKLILVGALLGLVVGFFQLFIIFGV